MAYQGSRSRDPLYKRFEGKSTDLLYHITAILNPPSNFSHKGTRRGLRPQPKKWNHRLHRLHRLIKKIRRKFLSQKHCYKLVSSCMPKYSCQKNKKLTDSITCVFRDCARKTSRLRRETRMISHRNFLMHGGNNEF
jgi:hypothetical protein